MLECKVIQVVELGLHTQFIGQIMDVKADEEVLGDKGFPDIEKVKPLEINSADISTIAASSPPLRT